MILGAGTGHKLQLTYSAAAAVNLKWTGFVVVVSAASPPVGDGTNTGPLVKAAMTTAAGATDDLVTGIASTKTRVGGLLRNADASNANSVTFKQTDGTNTNELCTVNLLPGEWVTYDGNGKWQHYDSNGGLYPSVGNAATQAEMEAGTATNKYVTPQGVNWHPGVAKFWALFTGNTTTILASWNVTSITDGTTEATVTIATDFSSANWVCQATAEAASTTAAAWRGASCRAIAAGTIVVFCVDGAATTALQDPTRWHVAGWGDQ